MSLLNGGSSSTLVVVIVIISLSVAIRVYLLYTRRKYRLATAKCPKCGEVFVPPKIPKLILRPNMTIKCPACGETNNMNLGTKEHATWPKEEIPKARSSENEDLERRIEESKYSK